MNFQLKRLCPAQPEQSRHRQPRCQQTHPPQWCPRNVGTSPTPRYQAMVEPLAYARGPEVGPGRALPQAAIPAHWRTDAPHTEARARARRSDLMKWCFTSGRLRVVALMRACLMPRRTHAAVPCWGSQYRSRLGADLSCVRRAAWDWELHRVPMAIAVILSVMYHSPYPLRRQVRRQWFRKRNCTPAPLRLCSPRPPHGRTKTPGLAISLWRALARRACSARLGLKTATLRHPPRPMKWQRRTYHLRPMGEVRPPT